jgi:nucleoside-diphosphate kinase
VIGWKDNTRPIIGCYVDLPLNEYQGGTVERTLIIIKPDAVQRGLIGPIVARFEQRGLCIVGMKFMRITRQLAERHYAIHKGKPFYEGLLDYITSGPVVVMALEGPQAIAAARATMGATRPAEASPGTIRADFGLEVGRNLVHGSDGPDTARFELDLFFHETELIEWSRDADRWILE